MPPAPGQAIGRSSPASPQCWSATRIYSTVPVSSWANSTRAKTYAVAIWMIASPRMAHRLVGQCLLPLSLDTYGERSPSGTGLKFYFRCKAEDAREVRAAFGITGNSWGCKRSVGANGADHGPAVEVYLGEGRFFCVTGAAWPMSPDHVALFDRAALLRLAALMPKGAGRKGDDGRAERDNSRSAVAFRLAAKLYRETPASALMRYAQRFEITPTPPNGAARRATPTTRASCGTSGTRSAPSSCYRPFPAGQRARVARSGTTQRTMAARSSISNPRSTIGPARPISRCRTRVCGREPIASSTKPTLRRRKEDSHRSSRIPRASIM